jgi:hypothetical protein
MGSKCCTDRWAGLYIGYIWHSLARLYYLLLYHCSECFLRASVSEYGVAVVKAEKPYPKLVAWPRNPRVPSSKSVLQGIINYSEIRELRVRNLCCRDCCVTTPKSGDFFFSGELGCVSTKE